MTMLSDDDANLSELSDEEAALAWDLWFDLAQSTNDADPPYTHGVLLTACLCDAAAAPEKWCDNAPPNDP